MPASTLQSVHDFIKELNENPDASFQELANHIDLWAVQEDCNRKQMIDFIANKTGRDYEEALETRPLENGDFIEFPVVNFSLRGSE